MFSLTFPASSLQAQGKYEIFPRDPKAETQSSPTSCDSWCPCHAPIYANHRKIRAHVTDEFIQHRNWMIDEFFTKHILPAMAMMTSQLQSVAMQHTLAVGSFFDAKHQLETQSLMQQLMSQAHKDYQPSEGICEIGTGTRSLSASARKSTLGHVALANHVMARQLRNKDSISGPTDNGDMKSRIANFKSKYCSTKDNGNGLKLLCGQDAPKERRNKDASFTQTLEGPVSLKTDFAKMTQGSGGGGASSNNNSGGGGNNNGGSGGGPNINPFSFGNNNNSDDGNTPGSTITVFSHDFKQSPDEFTYSDGGFGGTDPGSLNHARGHHETDNTGFLEVLLDGVGDNTAVEDISGSWRRSFSLDNDLENVKLRFNYKFFHASENDINEDAYVMVEVNGKRYGLNSQNYIQIARGSGGQTHTNFRSITLNIDDLSAGTNSIRLGIYKNSSNMADEDSSVAFDDISMTGRIKDNSSGGGGSGGSGGSGGNNGGGNNNGGSGGNGSGGNSSGGGASGNNNGGGNNGGGNNGGNSSSASENADGEDVFALMANLFGHDTLPFKARRILADKNGNPYPASYTYLDFRSIAAKRSVAQNGFSAIAAMRAEGDAKSNAGRFLKRLIVELGVPEDEVEELLGENPSYFAQMEVLSKKIYQNPTFFTELYDKPANVLRKRAAIRAQTLMQERDLYESLLRSEMALAVTLEAMLHDEHTRVYAELDKVKSRRGSK
ncbi:MAG: hypothetical protein MRY79_04845 [Alphaproteobacteria bacterium]|nr:hypothetical protein [Alphaproteobacteria bacterium]